MRYISLFAGIGGFDLALDQLGHECAYVNEWDKYAAQIYEKNFKSKVDRRSIRDVPIDDIPDHDLLCGGFPCQAFSVAGKRRGFEDTRGTLFFEIARILDAKRTSYLLLENVKGLLNHDRGRTFQTILRTLDELGYELQWQILNSKSWVPQNRERVFIIGNLRGKPRPKVFPFTGSQQEIDIPGTTAKPGAQKFIKTRFLNQNGSLISDSITLLASEQPAIIDTKRVQSKEARGQITKGYTGALHTEGTKAIIVDWGVIKEREHANSLDANYYKGIDNHRQRTGIMQDEILRHLTPVECERLQGFPDGWTEGISDRQRYKCLGNAVTVDVILAIARLL